MNNKLADALRAALPYVVADESDPDAEQDRALRAEIETLLAAHDARTFAQDCHDLADRAQLILRNSDFVQFHPAERYLLRSLIVTSHAVGDNAECAPHLYKEAE